MLSFGGTGKIGEDIATRFLENKGWKIVAQNYRKKFGEIDIIAQKSGILGFFEVKSVSHEIVSRETPAFFDEYRPEDRVDQRKIARIRKTVQAYLFEKRIDVERTEWQFHIISVLLSQKDKKAHIRHLEDIPLE